MTTAVTAVTASKRRRARVRNPWTSPGVVLSIIVLGLAILAALVPGLFTGHSPYSGETVALLEPSGEHWFGTDSVGRDLYARVIYGARVTLTVSIAAVIVGVVVGGSLGLLAGYLGGAIDVGIGILTNALMAFPPLILLLALASVLQPNLHNITLALAILTIPTNIRLARASTLAFAQQESVLAARAMGATTRRIIMRELLPNVLLQLTSYAMVLVSVLIVAEASLSFLGLGIPEPSPSWGNMIAEGLGGVFEAHPHIVLVPGCVLFLTVFAFNLVAEKVRSRFAPGEVQL